jgi:peptidoglycan/LPS O-acetylase OafA/YrhL
MAASSAAPQSGAIDGRQAARWVAAGASAVAAALYLLIGFGVVSVGESTTAGGAPDLLAFGLMTGGAFAVAAALLALRESRILWIALAALNVIVIVGYVAAASIRSPSYEPWGLGIKACQAVALVAVVYLAVRGPHVGRLVSRGRNTDPGY